MQSGATIPDNGVKFTLNVSETKVSGVALAGFSPRQGIFALLIFTGVGLLWSLVTN